MAKQSLNKIVPMPRRSLHHIEALKTHGLIAETNDQAALQELTERYVIAVTPAMVDQIDIHDLANDPIAKQFVPDVRELIILPDEQGDPIGDYTHAPLKALVHRHSNRVLLKPTLACAVYCRFCFRREMVGPHGDTVTQKDVDEALDYIAQHSEITEVILTGGDPLVLGAPRLQKLMTRLHAMPHVQWIRIHTRIPVVQPETVTADLLQAMVGPKPVTIALHINHVRELTDKAVQALADLHHAGHMLVSQSVLLRGINDNVSALAELFNALLRHRVKPYYLHHADLAAGTGHFRVSLQHGKSLMRQLHAQLSGLAMPHYVIDIPGGVAKIPVNIDYVQEIPGRAGHYWLIAPDGQKYIYTDPAVGS